MKEREGGGIGGRGSNKEYRIFRVEELIVDLTLRNSEINELVGKRVDRIREIKVFERKVNDFLRFCIYQRNTNRGKLDGDLCASSWELFLILPAFFFLLFDFLRFLANLKKIQNFCWTFRF